MPILNDKPASSRGGQGGGSLRGGGQNPNPGSGRKRSVNAPRRLDAGVKKKKVNSPRTLSPTLAGKALAEAQIDQLPVTRNSSVETSTAETSIAERLSADPAGNEETASPSVREPSEPVEAHIEVWTGSLSDGISQTKHLVVFYKHNRPSKESDPREIPKYQRSVRAFFWWLESEAVIRPGAQRELGSALDLFQRPEYQGIPEDLRDAARALRQRFDEENWGREDEDYASDTSNNNDTPVSPGPARAVSRPGPGQGVSSIRPPPPDHPIYGRNGIMHGVICYRSHKALSYKLNTALRREQVSARVFGHNGLTPGDWWPLQMVALFRGAHGHCQAGIYGLPLEGVYSVVVGNGKDYQDVDDDQGDVLYYSTNHSGVHTMSRGTQALNKSMADGIPVRVLRAANRKGWAPQIGIRYDGLYRVTGRHEVSRGGKQWFRYTLRRLPNQQSLQEIAGSVPDWQQKNDYEKIRDGYPGASI
ncbi:PUA-like domain-containing protein [Triangularia verruculosa]|uniref:PUA-like domain-containing protein n=1 Tax=Triangularia verruculosa TaxID=2587418 RepID=A0AAN6XA51_9PEZI|nr:PUA-like domain-containing protein [Triangularia verruculosa]